MFYLEVINSQKCIALFIHILPCYIERALLYSCSNFQYVDLGYFCIWIPYIPNFFSYYILLSIFLSSILQLLLVSSLDICEKDSGLLYRHFISYSFIGMPNTMGNHIINIKDTFPITIIRLIVLTKMMSVLLKISSKNCLCFHGTD